LQNNTQLILKPHNDDVYQFSANTNIILKSSSLADWKINGQNLGAKDEIVWTPPAAGNYEITAISGGKQETITITLVKNKDDFY